MRFVLVLFLRAYQYFLSPWLGRNCRFHPSCSSYAIESLQRYGAIKGGRLALLRVMRCHPSNPGGYDPVP